MNTRSIARSIVAAVIVAGAAGCPKDLPVDIPGLSKDKSDAQQIAEVLGMVEQGMERGKIFRVLAHVSPSYVDAEGRDYEDIREYLNDVFDRYYDFKIDRAKPRVRIDGNRAQVVETFGTRAKPIGSSPPLALQGQVSVYLEKVDGTWLIVEWGHLL